MPYDVRERRDPLKIEHGCQLAKAFWFSVNLDFNECSKCRFIHPMYAVNLINPKTLNPKRTRNP